MVAQEMKEETGLDLQASELVDLTALAYGPDCPGLVPSAGGCDETIRLFLYRKSVTAEELAALEGKCTGCAEEREQITLSVVPLASLWQVSPDAKTLAALFLYEKLKAAGKL